MNPSAATNSGHGPQAMLGRVLTGAAFWSYRSLVALVLCVGLVWTVMAGWDGVGALNRAGDAWPLYALAVLVTIGTFAGAVHVARRREPLDPVVFVIATVAVGLVLRSLYVAFVQTEWSNDFLHYWTSAQELASAGTYKVDDIYYQRALPLLVPLIEVFGASMLAVKVCNIILLALTQVAAYDILRRIASHQVAQAFTLIWLAVPETTFSTTIPSHDLTGVAVLALVFWLNVVTVNVPEARRRWGLRFVSLSIAMALALAYLEAARNLGTLLALVYALCAVTGLILDRAKYTGFGDIRYAARATLVQAVLGLMAIQGSQALLDKAELLLSADEIQLKVLRATVAAPNSMSDGSFSWYHGFNRVFTAELMRDAERFERFRVSVNASDFLERPVAVVERTFDRGERLFALGTQYSFYHRGFHDQHRSAALAMRFYNSLFAGAFALLLLPSLVRFLSRPGPPHLYVQVLLLAGLTLMCMTLLFNQPRYIYPIWFVGAAVIALEMSRLSRGVGELGTLVVDAGKLALQSALFVVVASGGAWVALNLLYTAERGRVVSGWELSTDQPATAAHDEFFSMLASRTSTVVPIRAGGTFDMDFGGLALQLEFPTPPEKGQHVSATHRVCVRGDAARQLAFHYYMPYARPEKAGVFTLALLQDGDTTWAVDLPGDGATHAVGVPFAPGPDGCSLLEFRLTANKGVRQESWRRASRTELFFPRLEPVPDPPPAARR